MGRLDRYNGEVNVFANCLCLVLGSMKGLRRVRWTIRCKSVVELVNPLEVFKNWKGWSGFLNQCQFSCEDGVSLELMISWRQTCTLLLPASVLKNKLIFNTSVILIIYDGYCSKNANIQYAWEMLAREIIYGQRWLRGCVVAGSGKAIRNSFLEVDFCVYSFS